jgi:hypothetical protein
VTAPTSKGWRPLARGSCSFGTTAGRIDTARVQQHGQAEQADGQGVAGVDRHHHPAAVQPVDQRPADQREEQPGEALGDDQAGDQAGVAGQGGGQQRPGDQGDAVAQVGDGVGRPQFGDVGSEAERAQVGSIVWEKRLTIRRPPALEREDRGDETAPMRRRLPLLLLIAAVAMSGCGTDNNARSDARAGTTAAPTPGGTSTQRPGATTPPAPGATATPAPNATPTPGATPAPAAGDMAVKAGATGAGFRGGVVPGRDAVRRRVPHSWRRGCPVGPVELRLLRVDHWGFDRRVHRGELIVHRDHAHRMLRVMERLFAARYPIQRLRLVDAYGADDDRSMAANNTSAFNCRRVSGSSRWSEHAYGRAIDVNPLRNPYVTRGGRVSPPAGRPYANRSLRAAGMIHGGDRVVRAFAAAGWQWGGYWSGSRDYQHFSSTGR